MRKPGIKAIATIVWREVKYFLLIAAVVITVLAWSWVIKDVKKQYALLDAQHEIAWSLLEKAER